MVTYTTSKTIDNDDELMLSSTITKSNDKESSNDKTLTPNPESNESDNKPDNTDTKSSSSSSSSFDDNYQVMKSLSFWTVIGLGSVVKAGSSNKHMSIGSGGINGGINLPRNLNTKSLTQT